MFSGCGALTGPNKVRGFEGDTVSLQCGYEEKLRNYQKYWCRKTGFLGQRCSGTIYTKADGQESAQGRVSVQDSPQELRFNVTLRALTLEDSGEYWCGVRRLGFDDTLLVSLVVLPGNKCPSFLEGGRGSGQEGGVGRQTADSGGPSFPNAKGTMPHGGGASLGPSEVTQVKLAAAFGAQAPAALLLLLSEVTPLVGGRVAGNPDPAHASLGAFPVCPGVRERLP